MVRTQIQLTEEQARKLRKLATTRHLSVARLIRLAVDRLIGTGVVIDIDEQRRRAIAAAGTFASGVDDLGSNHDKYLGEAHSR